MIKKSQMADLTSAKFQAMKNKEEEANIQYYHNYFLKNHGVKISEKEIQECLEKYDKEMVFPKIVELLEEKLNPSNKSLESPESNSDKLQTKNQSVLKSKEQIVVNLDFHGYNKNSAAMFSRRVLFDFNEKRDMKFKFIVGKGTHSKKGEKLRAVVNKSIEYSESQIKKQNEFDTILSQDSNSGVICYSIKKKENA